MRGALLTATPIDGNLLDALHLEVVKEPPWWLIGDDDLSELGADCWMMPPAEGRPQQQPHEGGAPLNTTGGALLTAQSLLWGATKKALPSH